MAYSYARDDEPSYMRRVYGRGFHDGQRKAMEHMNNARLMAIEQGLNGMQRKVLEATPVTEHWTLEKICSKLISDGHHIDRNVVMGCLRTMQERGVVREPASSCFVRTNPKPIKLVESKVHEPVDVPLDVPVVTPAAPPAPASPVAAPRVDSASPVDVSIKRMVDVVAGVRAIADSALKLAAEIEDVALDMEARIERLHADTGKLRQLQELLKIIGE